MIQLQGTWQQPYTITTTTTASTTTTVTANTTAVITSTTKKGATLSKTQQVLFPPIQYWIKLKLLQIYCYSFKFVYCWGNLLVKFSVTQPRFILAGSSQSVSRAQLSLASQPTKKHTKAQFRCLKWKYLRL